MADDLAPQYLSSRAGNPELEDDIARFRQVSQETEQKGFLAKMAENEGQFAEAMGSAGNSDAAQWMVNLPRNITVGAIDAVTNTLRTIDSAQQEAQRKQFESTGNPKHRPRSMLSAKDDDASTTDLDIDQGLVALRGIIAKDNEGLPDRAVQSAAQFFLPFAAWAKTLGAGSAATTVGNIVRGAGAEAATVATAFAPHQGRFADLLREVDTDNRLVNAYVDYLATDENEGVAEGRFKNVVDSLATSAALGSVILVGGKAMRANWREIAMRVTEPGPVPEIGRAHV